MMLIRLKGVLEMVTVTSAYGPQVGCAEKEKEAFLMGLKVCLEKCRKMESW